MTVIYMRKKAAILQKYIVPVYTVQILLDVQLGSIYNKEHSDVARLHTRHMICQEIYGVLHSMWHIGLWSLAEVENFS